MFRCAVQITTQYFFADLLFAAPSSHPPTASGSYSTTPNQTSATPSSRCSSGPTSKCAPPSSPLTCPLYDPFSEPPPVNWASLDSAIDNVPPPPTLPLQPVARTPLALAARIRMCSQCPGGPSRRISRPQTERSIDCRSRTSATWTQTAFSSRG